ncbi:UNVERIFIED_CONTAM: hypothetical protein Slati_4422500 [Sesamum latifolium]|uniref:Uncharacterized protein n=1 Tax=Sesamum latifolium TaxID=2727402 RepID=A0AAW2SRV2_9LAMI
MARGKPKASSISDWSPGRWAAAEAARSPSSMAWEAPPSFCSRAPSRWMSPL